jgi:hypothetical protein
MNDIIVEQHGGRFAVSGGPIIEAETFPTMDQACRYARRQAGDACSVIVKGEEQ